MDESKDVVDVETARRHASTARPPIDIQKLAEKVYQLMRAEARLQQVRGNRRSTRR
jgi:hypothetical protein